MVKEFRVREVMGDSLRILLDNLIPFLTISGIVALPIVAYALLLGPQSPEILHVLSKLLQILFAAVAAGALTYGVFADLSGRGATVRRCLGVGLSRVFPVLGIALCQFLFITTAMVVPLLAGLILLPLDLFGTAAPRLAAGSIAPTIVYAAGIAGGLAAYATAFVSVPCGVVERPGILGALRRSRELTRGRRLRVALVIVTIYVFEPILQTALRAGFDSVLVVAALSGFVTIVSVALVAIAVAVAYYHLRSRTEARDLEGVVAVFD